MKLTKLTRVDEADEDEVNSLTVARLWPPPFCLGLRPSPAAPYLPPMPMDLIR